MKIKSKTNMKNQILLIALTFFLGIVSAQNTTTYCDTCYTQKQVCDNSEELKLLYINKDVTTHFIAMDEIRYVDISSNEIAGDIPVENVVRIKPTTEGVSGVVTIITESYFVQYTLVYTNDIEKVCTRHNIAYNEIRGLVDPERTMTKSEMYDYATKMFYSNKKFYDVSTTAKKLRMTLNNIYTVDKYFFIDLSLLNKTHIQFDIDQIRFKIEDKKIYKATSFQSVEVKPLLILDEKNSFKRNYRNIFVFEKFTFPENKVLTIEVSEKQISGRTIILRINYSDILSADPFIYK